MTPLGYVLGKLKEWDYMTKCQPWKQSDMKLFRFSHGELVTVVILLIQTLHTTYRDIFFFFFF
uniref:Uncharacterized protein n=1 Tax=Manihot esculenta TaxID=3983 RepID=A0A2C9UQQ9_MANES